MAVLRHFVCSTAAETCALTRGKVQPPFFAWPLLVSYLPAKGGQPRVNFFAVSRQAVSAWARLPRARCVSSTCDSTSALAACGTRSWMSHRLCAGSLASSMDALLNFSVPLNLELLQQVVSSIQTGTPQQVRRISIIRTSRMPPHRTGRRVRRSRWRPEPYRS